METAPRPCPLPPPSGPEPLNVPPAVLLTCISVLQVLTVLKLLCLLIAYACPLRKTLLNACGRLKKLWSTATKPKVREKFEVMQCSMLVKALQITMAMTFVRFIFSQLHLFEGRQPPVAALDIALVLVYCLALILTQFQQLVTRRSLDLWYALFQAVLVLPFFFVSAQEIVVLSNWTFVLRVMLALAAKRAALPLLGNAVPSLLVMRLVGFHPQAQLFTGEITKITFLLLAVFSIRHLMFRLARSAVELKSQSIELEAVSALLFSFCDAVVEVDQECRIVENPHQLLTMLLRCSRSLADRDFLSLFCSEDREKVRCGLAASKSSESHALNARLLDSHGHHVQVELLHIRFVTSEEKVHRLVGVREFQDVNEVVDVVDAPVPPEDEATEAPASVLFDLKSLALLEANEEFRELCAKCRGGRVKLSKMTLLELSSGLSATQVTPQLQDLVNKQCRDREVRELELGTLSFMESLEVRAKLRAEYNRTLDCFLGVLMLFPASDLTKANVDLLPSKASKRGPGSRSSKSSGSGKSGSILALHKSLVTL